MHKPNKNCIWIGIVGSRAFCQSRFLALWRVWQGVQMGSQTLRKSHEIGNCELDLAAIDLWPVGKARNCGFFTEGKSMGNPVYYHQGCPVCGRTLRIRVTLLGKRVFCQHCGGGFLAMDASMESSIASESSASVSVCESSVEIASPLVEELAADRLQSTRVDELIEQAEWVLEQAASIGLSGDVGWTAID